MPANASSLRLIGMIPRPDEEYRAALLQSVESVKAAMTDKGIDPSRIAPMPTRMWPVAQDASGRTYALVSMCNQNGRPSAVPLSKIFPDDPSKPGALPDTFVPVGSWDASHPPSAGLPSDVPGVTAPIESAMPKPPPAPAGGAVADETSPSTDAEPDSERNPVAHDRASSPAQTGETATLSDSATGKAKTEAPSPEQETSSLIAGVLPGMKARGAVGELGGALLGIMAQQNPSVGRANFLKLMAEKATALQPGSSVYNRLKDALQTFDQIKDKV